MKDLSKFEPVKRALQQVVKEATLVHDNGTYGMVVLCHYWDNEPVYSSEREECMRNIAKFQILGNKEMERTERLRLAALPAPEIDMIFRLLEPIPRLVGTMEIYDDKGKRFSPILENVTELHIPQRVVDDGLVDYEEVKDKFDTDKMGQPAQIIKLKIKGAIIDVTRSRKLRNQIIPSKAMVTSVSFKALSAAGKMLWQEQNKRDDRFGFQEIN
jgi:hypothetical protein